MSHFYGAIQGGRGEATRAGHKSSGYRAYAASWSGRIAVYLGHDETAGKDTFRVAMEQHGQSSGWCGELASGFIGERPDMPTLLPTPTIESFSDEELVAEVKRRFGIDIALRQPQPGQLVATTNCPNVHSQQCSPTSATTSVRSASVGTASSR